MHGEGFVTPLLFQVDSDIDLRVSTTFTLRQ